MSSVKDPFAFGRFLGHRPAVPLAVIKICAGEVREMLAERNGQPE